MTTTKQQKIIELDFWHEQDARASKAATYKNCWYRRVTQLKWKIFQEKMNGKKITPPYKLGYLGIIPLVGFFVGIALTLYGIFRYKDRKLTSIGIACMLFTVLAYSSVFYIGNYSDTGKKDFEKIAQIQLNDLLKDIEYYKLQKGSYPDSLKQLESRNEMIIINDPIQSRQGKVYYNYKKLGEKYILFSSGSDRIKNTADDIYPKIENLKTVGWIKK